MATRPVNLRFPIDLFNALQEYAKSNNITVSEIIFKACIQYLENIPLGLCPLCHIQNNPEAQYCQGCGTALNPNAQGRQMETLNNVIETLKQLDERMRVLEKKVYK